MTDVEIYWPSGLPTASMFDGQDLLRRAGVEATCRVRPAQRGVDLPVLVLIASTALEPIFTQVLGHVGDEVFAVLKNVVHAFLRRAEATAPAPSAVVFESAATGAQFVFLPDLPDVAFRRAIELDPGEHAGRWVWDTSRERWQRFDETPAQDDERRSLT